MKLLELEPTFIRLIHHPEGGEGWEHVTAIADADGVLFLCPKCSRDQVPGVHQVLCWSRRVPDTQKPGPGRWRPAPASTGLHDLTLVGEGGSSSVALTSGCMAHFHVTDGEIQWA